MTSVATNSDKPWMAHVTLYDEKTRSIPEEKLRGYEGASKDAYQAWLKRQEERLAMKPTAGKRPPARIQVLEVRTDAEYVQQAMRDRRRAIFTVDGAKAHQQRDQAVNRRPLIDDCADPLAEFDGRDEIAALADSLAMTDMDEDDDNE